VHGDRSEVELLEPIAPGRQLARRLVPAAPLIKAVAQCLHAYPELNGWWRDGGFAPSAAVHVGIAIALRRGGVVAPALHDVDRLSVGRRIRLFQARAAGDELSLERLEEEMNLIGAGAGVSDGAPCEGGGRCGHVA
jgi:pyruvate dehydrogenase E2 component (dihydrolipoamide acetyltransferase)